MENLSKQFARPTPRESSIVGLKLDLRTYVSKMFPVDIDANGLWTTFAVIKKKEELGVKRKVFLTQEIFLQSSLKYVILLD